MKLNFKFKLKEMQKQRFCHTRFQYCGTAAVILSGAQRSRTFAVSTAKARSGILRWCLRVKYTVET